MEKKSFANRFGLIALMALSLFASTSAFAGNAPAPTQVLVANTPAQPVPMVGLVTDADNPARQPFQWSQSFGQAAGANSSFKVVTADPSHRLVIEDVSGTCSGGINLLALETVINGWHQYHFLPVALWNGTGGGSTLVLFYVDPGHDLLFNMGTVGSPAGAGNCYLSVSGYFISAQTLG